MVSFLERQPLDHGYSPVIFVTLSIWVNLLSGIANFTEMRQRAFYRKLAKWSTCPTSSSTSSSTRSSAWRSARTSWWRPRWKRPWCRCRRLTRKNFLRKWKENICWRGWEPWKGRRGVKSHLNLWNISTRTKIKALFCNISF